MDTGVLLPWVNRPEREVDHSHVVSIIRLGVVMNLHPICALWNVWDKLTFTNT